MDRAIQDGRINHGNYLGGVSPDRAHYLGRVAGLIDLVTGIDPFRGKAQIEILAAGKAAALLQDGLKQLLGGTRIGGGFQHHHGALLQILGDGHR